MLCFNSTLAAKLRAFIAEKGISGQVQVYHFHDWCGKQLKTYHVSVPAGDKPYWEREVEAVIAAVERGDIPRAQYGAVLIDEGHDFEAEWLQLVVQMIDPETNALLFLYDDAQSIYMPDGSWIDFGTPEWEGEYRRRVDGVMTMLEERGHWVYWMGMPIVSSETFQERVRLMNGIYEEVAESHPRVTFVEAWSLFEGSDGGYSEYLPDADGNLVDMRLDDGVHYTTAGAIRLAEHTFEIIAEDWGIPPGE